jgi:hypothetical protein
LYLLSFSSTGSAFISSKIRFLVYIMYVFYPVCLLLVMGIPVTRIRKLDSKMRKTGRRPYCQSVHPRSHSSKQYPLHLTLCIMSQLWMKYTTIPWSSLSIKFFIKLITLRWAIHVASQTSPQISSKSFINHPTFRRYTFWASCDVFKHKKIKSMYTKMTLLLFTSLQIQKAGTKHVQKYRCQDHANILWPFKA